MAFDYTGTSAGLFVRLGKLVNLGKEHRSAQDTVVTHIDEAVAKYTATSVDRVEYLGQLAGDKNVIADAAGRSLQLAVKDAMERTIIEQAIAEAPQKMDQPTLANALRVITIDMRSGTATQAIGTTSLSIGTVAATMAETATQNQGTLLLSLAPRYSYGGSKQSAKPDATDSILAETVEARCVRDARDGRLIRGNEAFVISGADPVDRLDRRWPQGSGASLALNATCGSIEASSLAGQNMLNNSGFERVNATPFALDWTVLTGTEGTDIGSTTTSYRGSRALTFTGKAALLHNIYQVMGQSGRPNIKTNSVYFFSAYIRAASGTLSGLGTFALQLQDSTGTAISGCSVTQTVSGIGTTWTRVTGSFTTPLNLPSEVRAAITFTVALTAGEVLYVDEVVLAQAAYLYAGGPGACVVAGSSDYQLDDRMTRAITKTTNLWQLELDRYLNLASLDIQFPSSATATISTTLIA